jgi:hypothetical protein
LSSKSNLSTALRKFVPVLGGSCHPEPKAKGLVLGL